MNGRLGVWNWIGEKYGIMSFRLLAIRPLSGCNEKFLKNLEENRIYQFYSDYEFFIGQNKITNEAEVIEGDVTEIKYLPTVLDNFYGNENININVSAIVGKNGSGKSSLVELLYAAFYNLAVTEKIINNDNVDKTKKRIKEYFKLFIDEFSISNDSHSINTVNLIDELSNSQIIDSVGYRNIFEEKLNKLDDAINDKTFKEEYKKSEENHNRNTITNLSLLSKFIIEYKVAIRNQAYLIDNLFFEIYFEINNELYTFYNLKKDKISFKKFKKEEIIYLIEKEIIFSELKNKTLFYSLVVNYSLYGLNSNELGNWIEKIFHKNDGYQTPIVINPYRKHGNILINTENEIVRNRLMCNAILNDNLKNVTPNNRINKIRVSFKSKVDYKINLNIFEKEESLKEFIKLLFDFFKNQNDKTKAIEDFEYLQIVLKSDIFTENLSYILNKLERMRRNYDIYDNFIFIKEKESDYVLKKSIVDLIVVKEFLDKIQIDNSHITFKIRQAINFMFLNIIEEDLIYSKFKNESLESIKEETIQELFTVYENQILKRNGNYYIDIINLLPPSIFNVDYLFDNGSPFSDLSSGEKQQIFSVNSILYHLINLNSTFQNDFEYKYPYVNLILDEVELYAHPEMQRKYISQILSGIARLDIENIKGINILFITHSPFILSDIPKQNVLFMEVDEGSKKAIPSNYKGDNTFGENIHQMLTDGFFIENTIGEFAKSKINEIASFYKKVIDSKNDDRIELIKEYKINSKNFIETIALIGEDYIRNILSNHIAEIEKKLGSNEFLERRIKLLEEELESVKNQLE